MINSITSDRSQSVSEAVKFDGEHGHGMQVLTPAETAEVSGGFLLLYWLLTQPAY